MDLAALCAEVDTLYRDRSCLTSVEQSIVLINDWPGSHQADELQWRQARAFFFLGQEAPTRAAKRDYFRQGRRAAHRAVSLAPHRVEGHFWLGVNAALLAEVSACLVAPWFLLQAWRPLNRAIALAPDYHGAGPLRVKARLWHKLPGPLGQRARSERLYRQALVLAPTNCVTRIFYAELLYESGRPEEACAYYQSVLNLPAEADWQVELARDRALAAEALRLIA